MSTYQDRPIIAYVHTHLSGGANRYETEREAWADSLRIMKSRLLVGGYPQESSADISYPNGRKIKLTPRALSFWL